MTAEELDAVRDALCRVARGESTEEDADLLRDTVGVLLLRVALVTRKYEDEVLYRVWHGKPDALVSRPA